MNLLEAIEQAKTGRRVVRPGSLRDVLFYMSGTALISQESLFCYRTLNEEERSATDWVVEHVTWTLRQRGPNRMYLFGLTPYIAEWTFKQKKALRFLSKEAAFEERKGWVDPEARKTFAVVKLTKRSG